MQVEQTSRGEFRVSMDLTEQRTLLTAIGNMETNPRKVVEVQMGDMMLIADKLCVARAGMDGAASMFRDFLEGKG